jgi:hypothetical protein
MSCPLAWSMGTGSCLVLVTCFSHLNVVSKVRDFQSFACCFQNCTILFVIPLFLSYSIQLYYYFPIKKMWQLNTQAPIITSYWLHYVAPTIYFLHTISNNYTKTCSISICNNKYQYLNWHPPFLLQPLQMAWGWHCVVLAHSGTSHCSSLGRWLTSLCDCKWRERTV